MKSNISALWKLKQENHIEYDLWRPQETIKYLHYIPADVNNVLDVGCGRGEFLYSLKEKGFETYGCDFDKTCLAKSAQFAEVREANVLELSKVYSPDTFDLITCLHVIEHVIHPYIVCQELKKVSRQYILIAVPNARAIASDERETHLYSWNSDTFRNFLESNGLKILRMERDRINVYPNIVRAAPVINRILLKFFVNKNELIALCSK